MALLEEIGTLNTSLGALGDALRALRVTVVEDRPPRNEVLLQDRFEFGAEDLLGWLEEARAFVVELQAAASSDPVEVAQCRAALWNCHVRIHRMRRQFVFDLNAYEHLDALKTLGRERRGEWRGWSSSVIDALAECRQPFQAVEESVARCWRELVDRAGQNAVSVRATNIGQQITVRDPAEALLDAT